MSAISDETPRQVPDKPYICVLIEVRRCLECHLPLRPNLGTHNPRYHHLDIKAQWARANWPDPGPYIAAREGYICKPCAEKGLATWTCALCNEPRTGEPQESIGDPPENLCTNCYESVSAARWQAAVDRLNDRHQFDFR